MTDSETPEFKLILVGDSGVGKTTFVKRHITGEFEKQYIEAHAAEVHPLRFNTNRGYIQFNVWDKSTQELSGDLTDHSYMTGAQCAIIMFDVTSRLSYKSVPTWYKEIIKRCGDIPIVLCGNKLDIKERKVKPRMIIFHRKKKIPYCEISAKTNYNFEQPFLRLIRKVSGSEEVFLVEPPLLVPPEGEVDSELMGRYQIELNDAESYPLPESSDDDQFQIGWLLNIIQIASFHTNRHYYDHTMIMRVLCEQIIPLQRLKQQGKL